MKKILKGGFTLIEILFLVLVLGLAVALLMWLFSMSNIRKTEDAKVARVIDVYRQIDDASSYYMAKYATIPTKDDLLRTGILKSWPETADEIVFNPTCLAKVSKPKEYLLVLEDLVGGPEYDLLGFIPCVEYQYALLYNNSAYHKLSVAVSPFSPTIAYAADSVKLDTLEDIKKTRDETTKNWKTKAFDFDSEIYGVVYTIKNDVCKTKEECKALLMPDELVTLDPEKDTSTWLEENKGESNEPDFDPTPNPTSEYMWKLHEDVFTACSKTCNGVKTHPYICTKIETDEPVASAFCTDEKPIDFQEPCNEQPTCYYWQENAFTSLCLDGQITSEAKCTDINGQAIVDDSFCSGAKPESIVSACDKDYSRQCFYSRNYTRVTMTGTKYNFYVYVGNPISPAISVTNYASNKYENDGFIYEQGELAEPLRWQICITPKDGKNGWQYNKWGVCSSNANGTQKKSLICMLNGAQQKDSYCGTKPELPSEVSRPCLATNPPTLFTDPQSQGSFIYVTIGAVPADMASSPISAFSPTKQSYQARLNNESTVALTPDAGDGFSSDYFVKIVSRNDGYSYVPDIQNEVKRSYGSGSLMITYNAKKLDPSYMYPQGSTYWSAGLWSPCMGCGISERSRNLVCRDAKHNPIDDVYCKNIEKPIDKEACDTGLTCNPFDADCFSVNPDVFLNIPASHSTKPEDTAAYIASSGYSTYFGRLLTGYDGLFTVISGTYKASPYTNNELVARLRSVGLPDKRTFMKAPKQFAGTPEYLAASDIRYPMSVRNDGIWADAVSPQFGVEYNFAYYAPGEKIAVFPGKKVATRTYLINGNKSEYSFYEMCVKKVGTIIYEDTAQGYSNRCGFVPFKGLNTYSCKVGGDLPYLSPDAQTWMGSSYEYWDFQEELWYLGSGGNYYSGDFGFCDVKASQYPNTSMTYMPEPCQSGQVVTGEGCKYCPYGSKRIDPPKYQGGGVWYFPQAWYCYKNENKRDDQVVQCEYWDGQTSTPYYNGDSHFTNHWFLRKWSITIP